MKQLFILKGKLCLRKISLGSGDGFGVFKKRNQIPRSQNSRAGNIYCHMIEDLYVNY